MLGDVDEPLRVLLRERVEDEIQVRLADAEGRDRAAAHGRPQQREDDPEPVRRADPDERPERTADHRLHAPRFTAARVFTSSSRTANGWVGLSVYASFR